MPDAERDLKELCAFMNTQDYLEKVSIDVLRGASRREELGITSLAVIMLVANYLEASGMPEPEFNPDWITRLDHIDGIVSVFREIDCEKSKLATV